jgi:glycosyltransferase involved in cell wall biosynthesis
MGVDLGVMRRRSPYAAWPGHGACRIFSCGRLNPVKGHTFLIEAVRLLRERGIDAQLEIAGEDEAGGDGYRRVIEAGAAERGLSAHVRLLGALPEEAIRARLEAAHVFALASLDEGVPVAVMEAMAMEMPVVVTDVGGARELIDDGADALLVPPEDAAALADRVEGVLRDPDRAARLGAAARGKIAARFHHGRSARALAEGLRRLGHSPPRVASADALAESGPESDLSEA